MKNDDQLAKMVKECFQYSEGSLVWVRPSKYHSELIGLSAGVKNELGYVIVQINGKKYKRGRLVFLYHYGRLPRPVIDHINRIRDDDRIENLREASHRLNCLNHGRMNITLRRGKRFQVRFGEKNIGYFKTRKEAENAYTNEKYAYGV